MRKFIWMPAATSSVEQSLYERECVGVRLRGKTQTLLLRKLPRLDA